MLCVCGVGAPVDSIEAIGGHLNVELDATPFIGTHTTNNIAKVLASIIGQGARLRLRHLYN